MYDNMALDQMIGNFEFYCAYTVYEMNTENVAVGVVLLWQVGAS